MSSRVMLPKPKSVLLDIEGTTSSISFVHDVLFPFVRTRLADYLDQHWDQQPLQDDIAALKQQATIDIANGVDSVPVIIDAGGDDEVKKSVIANVFWQMDADRKIGALKQLQGHVWQSGYEQGLLRGHVYDDVPGALDRWKNQLGLGIFIYSSGSVFGQKLIFGYSDHGDLLKFIDGHFDTAIGNKLESASYLNIAKSLNQETKDLVFLTDSIAEAKAAREAGLTVVLSMRPGNKPIESEDRKAFPCIDSFDQLEFS